jgi:hypothetical protein
VPAAPGGIEYSVAIETGTGSRWFLHDEPPDGAATFREPAAAIDAAQSSPIAVEPTPAPAPEPDTLAPRQSAAEQPAAAPPDTPDPTIATDATDAPDAPDSAVLPARVPHAPEIAMDWLEAIGTPVPRRRWPWSVAASLLALTLTAQLIHVARDELAPLPGIGPLMKSVYAILGRELAAPVELDQYSTIDLTAVAEPVTADHGWLVIETRVQNRGPKVQPFPHILVRIRDRWQETIAGRYFSPEEYVVRPQSDYSRMNIGSMVDAQFIIVDPGPSATGFELEFCAPVEDGFRCDSE